MPRTKWFLLLAFLVTIIVILYVLVFARVGEGTTDALLTRVQFSSGQELLVEIADDLNEQVIGLSFRESLKDGTGMLFTYSDKDERLFWMKDMRFPIDIVWLTDGEVVGIERNVPPAAEGETPKIYVSPKDVTMVLEVPAGYMERNDIGPGVHINVTDVRK